MSRHLLLLGISSCLLIAAGCSDGAESSERIPVFVVKGKITMASAPVAGAFVTFRPVDTKTGRLATGTTNDAGEYTLTTYDFGDGAGAGDYVVLVTKVSSSSSSMPSEEEMHAEFTKGEASAGSHGSTQKDSGLVLPEKYASPESSDLKATVTDGGDNTFNFDLKP